MHLSRTGAVAYRFLLVCELFGDSRGIPFIKNSMLIARLAVIRNLSVRAVGLWRIVIRFGSSGVASPVGGFVSPVGGFIWLAV